MKNLQLFILCALLLAPPVWMNTLQASPMNVHRKIAGVTMVQKQSNSSTHSKNKKIEPEKKRRQGKFKSFIREKWRKFKRFIQENSEVGTGILLLMIGLYTPALWFLIVNTATEILIWVIMAAGIVAGAILLSRAFRSLFPKMQRYWRWILSVSVALLIPFVLFIVYLSSWDT